MTCENKLAKNFLRQCGYKPKAGLENNIWIANTKEIDKAVSQLSASKMTISTLALVAGAKLYRAEGSGKYPQGNTELVKGDNGSAWKHGNTIRILYYGDEQREQLQNMIQDGRFSSIIEKRDSGTAGELTYDVLGYEGGMAVQTVVWNSNENDGVVEITLATEEGEEEATDRKIFMDTDLATTKTWIETNTEGYVAPV